MTTRTFPRRTKPPVLHPGNRLALVSLSSPLAAMVPRRVDQAMKALRDLGFEVILSQHAMSRTGHTAGSARERAEDLNELFRDPSVHGIISLIGGFHSNQILEYLDYEAIAANPKIFVGFSDMTVVHFALFTQAGVTTFYGPAALTHFGEPFGIDAYTLKHFRAAVCSPNPIGRILPSAAWTDEFLDWFSDADLQRPRAMKKNVGYRWLKTGRAHGLLIGGCITSMLHLRGTPFWPNFKDCILFWESPESPCSPARGESLARIDSHLTDLRLSGVFDDIRGMVVGRPKALSDTEVLEFEKLVKDNTAGFSFPILANVDIGHTDPVVTLPLGCASEMDSETNTFSVVESGVVDRK